jgi:pantoate--beta-alanine ligase
MRGVLATEPLASADYVEIVAGDSFEPAMWLRGECLALLAVRFGKTRLIDNMLIDVSGAEARCVL